MEPGIPRKATSPPNVIKSIEDAKSRVDLADWFANQFGGLSSDVIINVSGWNIVYESDGKRDCTFFTGVDMRQEDVENNNSVFVVSKNSELSTRFDEVCLPVFRAYRKRYKKCGWTFVDATGTGRNLMASCNPGSEDDDINYHSR